MRKVNSAMRKIFKKFSDSDTRADAYTDAYCRLIDRIASDDRLHASFLSAPRGRFIAPEFQDDVAVDAPISIPGGQTNSQPTTVAIMLSELDPRPGDKILDVGFGSGWTTALLAVLTGSEGWVYGIEVRDEAYEFGKSNLTRFRAETRIANFEACLGDGSVGWPEHAPFDRILVSAGAERVPPALKDQLRSGGRMVVPVDQPDGSQSLFILQKQNDGSFHERHIPGFRFVPLVNG